MVATIPARTVLGPRVAPSHGDRWLALVVGGVRVGAQGIIGEVLCPKLRRELLDVASGMFIDTLQYVDEVVARIDVVQPTRRQRTLDDADTLGTDFTPAEQPRLSIVPTLA
ncbi:MAG: hypothetical protein ACI8PT_004380 [Gammaproteobacteria bacterium]|jgi:hypothetical protein